MMTTTMATGNEDDDDDDDGATMTTTTTTMMVMARWAMGDGIRQRLQRHLVNRKRAEDGMVVGYDEGGGGS
jgi:hypothetical protein